MSLVHDTMLFQGVVEPLESSSLKPTGARLWGDVETAEAQEVKQALRSNGVGLTHRYDLIPWAVLGPYAGQDAVLTARLFVYQQQQVEAGEVAPELVRVFERDLETSKLLYRMEQRGIAFDAEGMRAEAQKMRVEVARAKQQLPFAPATINQAKRWFFGAQLECDRCQKGRVSVEVPLKSDPTRTKRKRVGCERCGGTGRGGEGLGLPPIKVTDKTREPMLDDEVTSRLVADGAPGAREWQTVGKLQSALSKWYEAWPDLCGPDGRIRTNFRQGRMEADRPGQKNGGAISGRLSVERVQLQAIPRQSSIPKGIRHPRQFFGAKPDHQLYELDMSQAEVRIATWLCRAYSMAAVLARGSDVHGQTATEIFGVKPDDEDWEKYRSVAKRLTFAMLYGAGVRTTRAQILQFTGIDYGEAKTRQFVEQYRAAFPEFERVGRLVQRKADRTMGGCGFIRLAGGRLRYFGWAEHTHKALNASIQGGQAEAIKMAMLEIDRRYPGVLISMVHDSVWVEAPDAGADAIVAGVRQIMSQTFEQLFSTDAIPVEFPVDVKRLDKNGRSGPTGAGWDPEKHLGDAA